MSQEPKPQVAVALTYESPSAPRVVAVGRGWLGQKIVETAREHGVPLREDPILAEALSTLELDTEIPPALYEAVAKVIAFVLRAGKAGAATARPPAPKPATPYGGGYSTVYPITPPADTPPAQSSSS